MGNVTHQVRAVKNWNVAFSFPIQVVFQQGTTKLSVEKDKTSVVSDVGISFTDPRSQNTFFSTDFENHEFHLPKGVKVLSVKKASTERVCIIRPAACTVPSEQWKTSALRHVFCNCRSQVVLQPTWTLKATAKPSSVATKASTLWAELWSSKWVATSSSGL